MLGMNNSPDFIQSLSALSGFLAY